MSTTTLSSFSGPRNFIIRPLDGQNQVYENVPGDATVRSLKERVFVAEGIPIEDQKLIYGAEIMDGPSLLFNYIRVKRSTNFAKTPGPLNPTTSARYAKNSLSENTKSGHALELSLA